MVLQTIGECPMHYQSHRTRYNQSLTEHSLSSQQTLTMIAWVITSIWVVSKVSHAFDVNAFAQAALCDLIKAFDCVDLYDLITKLKNYGLYKEPNLFLKPFLNNSRHLWRQEVCIDDYCSQARVVAYGVPQGSKSFSNSHKWSVFFRFSSENLSWGWH